MFFEQKAGSFLSFPVNLSKTQLLHLGTFINIHTYLIYFITVLPADKVLDLDIITDNDVKYSSDISSIISKARSRNYIIVRSFLSHNNFSSLASLYHVSSSSTRICFTSLEPICFKVHF